ncbi:MAG: V-type ATPase 116kDa subunit family protein [Marinifilaceae bacterium]
MKKLTSIIFYKDYPLFLEKLRDLGVVHIFTKKNIHLDNESLMTKMNLLKTYNDTIKFISRYSKDDLTKENNENGEELFSNIEKYRTKLEKLESSLAILKKDISTLEPWGEFSKERLLQLSEAGARIDFFICNSSKFKEEWVEENNAIEIADESGQRFFITVSYDGKRPEIDAEPFEMPESSLSEMYENLQSLVKERESILSFFSRASQSVTSLEKAKNSLKQDLDFETIVESSEYAAEDKLIVLEAWLPFDAETVILPWLENRDVYYTIEKPEIGDNVPVKLKNGKFASLFEFIGELYSMPKYGEIDLTPFFAPFFVIFFGLCLGDAGYGLLIIVGATLYKFKANKKTRPILTLLQWLGLGTVAMGLLVGTFFGINLIESDITWLSEIKKYMLDSSKVFNLALIIGAVQVVFGMFLKVGNAVKQFGWGAALSTIGWLILIFGQAAVYLMKESGIDTQFLNYGVLSVSGVLILLLNNPKRNVFINFGAGLWDIYNMATGLLGDILSYIRLFALGISSSVLGLVFNDIAVNMSGDTPVVSQLVMVLILVFGHGINIFMAGLGSFVHPMRLTFVEFYKNAGFTGGSKKYIPFQKITN